MSRARVLATAALALALGAAGCRPRLPAPELPADPARLLGEVRAAQDRITRVRGQARVHVEAKGFDGTVSQFIAAEKPDRLRVEALDFFGNPVVVLAADGDAFALYDGREKVFYRGRPTPENLARLVPFAIDARTLVTILCGSAPLLEGTPREVIPGRDAVQLVLEAGARVQTLAVGPEAMVERSRVRLAGGAGAITDADVPAPGTFDLRFDAFRSWGGTRFPSELSLAAVEPKVKLDLRWTEVEVNGEVDRALFRLSPPRGARIVDLDRQARE